MALMARLKAQTICDAVEKKVQKMCDQRDKLEKEI